MGIFFLRVLVGWWVIPLLYFTCGLPMALLFGLKEANNKLAAVADLFWYGFHVEIV